MDDKKDNIKSKLVLLTNDSVKEKEKIKLTEEELEVKEKLIAIEKKIDSLENIVDVINEELSETFYSSDVFMTIVASAALRAATDVVNEHFGLEKEE